MNRPDPLRSEEGFVLVAAMLVLLILVVLGISATSTSILEERIAGNDKAAKTTFYQADGGTGVATEMIEQNIACPTGFSSSTIGSIQVSPSALDFWAIGGVANADPILNGLPSLPSDTQRVFYWPQGYANGTPHTNVTLAGRPVQGKGGALQQEAGYEGKGKGAAQGTAAEDYKIFTQRYGVNNSEALLLIQWRHVLGTEGNCKY